MAEIDRQEETIALLREIRDLQRAQGERQIQAIAEQRDHVRTSRERLERADGLQTLSEHFASKSLKRGSMLVICWLVLVVLTTVTLLLLVLHITSHLR